MKPYFLVSSLIAAALIASPAQAQTGDPLKVAYCSRNWKAAESIAHQSYQALPAANPQKAEWLRYSLRMANYRLGVNQPNATEWKAMGCPTDDTNIMVTEDGRVIDLSGLSGTASTDTADTNNYGTYSGGYTRKNGCVGSCSVNVGGYTKKNGTYVAPYTRNAPRRR
jgi:hypothetical protein